MPIGPTNSSLFVAFIIVFSKKWFNRWFKWFSCLDRTEMMTKNKGVTQSTNKFAQVYLSCRSLLGFFLVGRILDKGLVPEENFIFNDKFAVFLSPFR